MRTPVVPAVVPAVVLSILSLAGAACGPLFAVVPPSGAPQIVAQGGGVTLTVLAEQWRTSPSDLADRVTPIAVVLRNDAAVPMAVALADFELIDDENDRATALNPFYTPIAENLQLSPEQQVAYSSPRLAQRGRGGGFHGGFRGGFRGGVRVGGPRYVPAPSRRGWGGGGVVVRPGRWGFHPGFSVYGPYRRFYGPGIGYWGGAWYGPVGTPYYEGNYSAPEVLQYALPEGVMQPGSEARGFVYFERITTDRTRTLRLRYRPRDAQTGAMQPPIEVTLVVVRN